ncbi:hypothetical protein DFH09DRAFT_1369644 [Mycena vulgaris]|nr:hypothetical protein DFH09DRAFT_1369644 [Mycena vulgaris]
MTPDFPQDQIVLSLPALYPNLDPDPIPDPNALDTLLSTGTKLPSIDGAVIALNGLASISRMGLTPIDASPFLWPRVWKWIDFLHTYWDYLPGFSAADSETEACLHDAYILMTLARHEETARLIYATDGVRFLLSRAWKILIYKRSSSPEVEEAALQDAGRILNIITFDMAHPRDAAEVLDALGGGIGDLAAAVVAHLARGTVLPKSDMSIAGQGSAITFCKERDQDDGPLRKALLSNGIVAGLVAAISALDGVVLTGNELTAPTIRFCFDELLKYLLTPPGYPWVTEALEAGLLQVIVSYGATANPDASDACSVYPHIQQLLGAILPGALVYHRSVTQIKQSFKDIKVSSAFKISPVFEAWEVLVALIETRVGVLDSWNARDRQRSAACDNMNCGKIDQKDKFGRCAECRAVHYCSRKCQASDWRNGHRDVCQELASAQYHNPETLNARERSFMRAVLHHDYEELIYNVSYLQIKFIHEHPTEQFVTRFDYSRPFGVPIDVIATSAVPTIQLEDFKIEWRTRLARAVQSGGKVEMHLMLHSTMGYSFLLEPSETARVSLTLFHECTLFSAN